MATSLDKEVMESALGNAQSLSAVLCFSGLVISILIGAILAKTRLFRGAGFGFFVLLSIVFVCGIAFRVLQFPLCIDDAYIDFRYVFNLLRGVGLIYQYTPLLESQAHNVLGISSPLHIAALTGVCLLFGSTDVPHVSRLFNLGLDELNFLLLAFLTFRLTGRRSLVILAAFFYSFNSYSIYEVVRGKETPLLVSLLLSYMLFLSYGKNFLSALVAGLIAVTRPEGVFFLAADFLSRWFWVGDTKSLAATGHGTASVTGSGSTAASGTGSTVASGTGSTAATGTGSTAEAGTGSSAATGSGSVLASGHALQCFYRLGKIWPLYLLPAFIFVFTQVTQCLLSGTFVPSGMVAKWIIYDRPVYFGFQQLSDCLLAFLFGRELPLSQFFAQWLGPAQVQAQAQSSGALLYVLYCLLYFGLLSAFAAVSLRYRELRGYVFSLYLFGLFFGVLNAVMLVFPWYYAWWVPLASIFWVLVLRLMAGRASSLTQGLYGLTYIVALLVPILSWSINVRPGEFLFPGGDSGSALVLPVYRIDAMQSRLPSYEAAARFVAAQCQVSAGRVLGADQEIREEHEERTEREIKEGQEQSVAAGELGILGYNLPAVRIIDLHGIISPDMLKLYDRNRPYKPSNSLIRFPASFYSTLKPDWIVVFDLFLPEGLLQLHEFQRQYEVVKFYPHKVFGEGTTGLYVLKRRVGL